MELPIFIVIGIIVGIAGAMLGIGGGIIIVPLMSFLMGASPQEAAGTSMVVVMFNSISGACGYIIKKMICIKAAVIFSIATIPGAVLGSYVANILQGKVLYLIFGLFFCYFAVSMYIKSSKDKNIVDNATVPEKFNWKLGTICSVAIGFIASILGIGGGIIHVPMMTYVLRFPYKVAVATSTFILAISAIAGTVSHAYLGHVLWTSALGLGIGAMIGAQIGVLFLGKAKSKVLLKITSILVLITGLKFLSTIL